MPPQYGAISEVAIHQGGRRARVRPADAPARATARTRTEEAHRPPFLLDHSSILQLQRTIGNKSTARLLSGGSSTERRVQRFSITASDLDRAGERRIAGFLGMGTSPYATIRNTLAEYEAEKRKDPPGSEANQERLLDLLEKRCVAWLDTNRGADAAARRKVVQNLLDEVPYERVALSKKLAQARYMENLVSEDTSDPHRLKLATDQSRQAAFDATGGFAADLAARKGKPKTAQDKLLEARMNLVTQKGITPAEHLGIIAYTYEDYTYMNPATADSQTWMEDSLRDQPVVRSGLRNVKAPAPEARAGGGGHGGGESDVSGHRGGEDKRYVPTDEEAKMKVFREEGSLLSAIAMQGLAKLDPFEGITYRGETMSEADLNTKVVPGSVGARPNLNSTSKGWSAALTFASGNLNDTKDIAVFWVIDHPPGVSGGRDIELLSAAKSEGEVLNMVGSRFKTLSLTELVAGQAATGPHAAYKSAILADQVMRLARKVYVVNAVAVPKA